MTFTHPAHRQVVHGVDFGADGRIPPNAFARQLKINVATAYRWSQRGARNAPPLQLLKIGGRTFVTADAWDAFHRAVNGVPVSA